VYKILFVIQNVSGVMISNVVEFNTPDEAYNACASIAMPELDPQEHPGGLFVSALKLFYDEKFDDLAGQLIADRKSLE